MPSFLLSWFPCAAPAIIATMTATKITFGQEIVDYVMPVQDLNAILQTSVTTQTNTFFIFGTNMNTRIFYFGINTH